MDNIDVGTILIWLVCGTIGLALLIYLLSCIKILKEYERAVIFRLGRVRPERGPGIILVMPFIERAVRVDLRVQTIELPVQDLITKDNVPVKVKAILYYQVADAVKSEIEVEYYSEATENLALTTLRYVGGSCELDDFLSGSQRISERICETVDEQTEKWGLKINLVELKAIDVHENMTRVIAAQAEAERQKRAKIIAAEGELLAAEKLSQAAQKMSENPISVQLRYMQTLAEIGAENNTTVVFPLPMELLPQFLGQKKNV